MTGATGFIGMHVVERLIKDGEDVRVLARDPLRAESLVEMGAKAYFGDITDAAAVAQAVAGCDVVVHAAGHVQDFGERETFRRVNVDGTRNVLDAVAAHRVPRLLHVSTIGVYGTTLFERRVTEDDPPGRMPHPYTETKVEAEALVRKRMTGNGLAATIVRPGNIYGPGNWSILYTLARALQKDAVRLVNGARGRGAFLFVEDCAEGMLRAARADRAVGATYNLVNEEPATWRDVLDGVARIIGRPPERREVPLWQARIAAWWLERRAKGGRRPPVTRFTVEVLGHDAQVSGARARKELGFEPKVTLAQGLERSAAWLRSALEARARPRASPHT